MLSPHRWSLHVVSQQMITACWSALALAAAVKVLTSGHLLTMRSPAGTALLSSITLAVSSACVSRLHASLATVGRSWNAHQFRSVEQLLMCSEFMNGSNAGLCGQLVFWFIRHSLHSVSLFWGGDSLVVRAPESWLKGSGFESLQEWWENFLLQGQFSVLTLYFSIRSTPVLPQ